MFLGNFLILLGRRIKRRSNPMREVTKKVPTMNWSIINTIFPFPSWDPKIQATVCNNINAGYILTVFLDLFGNFFDGMRDCEQRCFVYIEIPCGVVALTNFSVSKCKLFHWLKYQLFSQLAASYDDSAFNDFKLIVLSLLLFLKIIIFKDYCHQYLLTYGVILWKPMTEKFRQ